VSTKKRKVIFLRKVMILCVVLPVVICALEFTCCGLARASYSYRARDTDVGLGSESNLFT
jgi:hypothetical protein